MEIILFISVLLIGGIASFFSLGKISQLQNQIQELLIYKGRFEQAQITIEDLKLQNKTQKNEQELQNQKITNFEKQNELLIQSQNLLNQEKQEWAINKEKILYQLSEELIRKNNEEQTKFGKHNQENIEKITQNLYKNFEGVLNKVNSLDDDVKKSSKDIDLTKNALLNPSGAGKTAEITLENILKASGLKEKTNIKDSGDYILQSHFFSSENIAKKPDALVFLPGNQIVIIDSKSSSFFLDLQKAKEEGRPDLQELAKAKLKETMRKHLEDLKKRDYAKAKEFDDLKQNNQNNIFTTIMFLQTEKMLEIVNEIDTNFIQKALDLGIWVLTPIGVYNLLTQGKFTINRIKQQENVEELRVEVQKLIEAIITMYGKAADIGKATSKAVKSYNEFASSFNQRFLVRVNNLNKLGIESDKKTIGNKLEKYTIVNDENIIDGQTENE
jgi:DNA recombination protein RmuC